MYQVLGHMIYFNENKFSDSVKTREHTILLNISCIKFSVIGPERYSSIKSLLIVLCRIRRTDPKFQYYHTSGIQTIVKNVCYDKAMLKKTCHSNSIFFSFNFEVPSYINWCNNNCVILNMLLDPLSVISTSESRDTHINLPIFEN